MMEPAGINTPQDWVATENAKIKAIQRQKLEKSVMDTDTGRRQVSEAMAIIFSDLARRDIEVSPAAAGRSAVEIFQMMNLWTERHRKEWAKRFDEIGK